MLGHSIEGSDLQDRVHVTIDNFDCVLYSRTVWQRPLCPMQSSERPPPNSFFDFIFGLFVPPGSKTNYLGSRKEQGKFSGDARTPREP